MTNTEAPAPFRTAADALAFAESLLAEARFRDGRATALVADGESAEYLVELLLAAGVEDVLERPADGGVVVDVILD